MLANIDWAMAPCEPITAPDYSGFPLWEAFVTEPNREERVCDFFKEKLELVLYWPHFVTKRRRRGSFYVPALRSVIPCVVLAPIEYLARAERARILDWVRLRPLHLGRFLLKSEIDDVRGIEAKLNIPLPNVGPVLVVGQTVTFADEIKASYLGDAEVLEVAPGGRIRVKSAGKLIGRDRFWISSAEVVAK